MNNEILNDVLLYEHSLVSVINRNVKEAISKVKSTIITAGYPLIQWDDYYIPDCSKIYYFTEIKFVFNVDDKMLQVFLPRKSVRREGFGEMIMVMDLKKLLKENIGE